MDISYIYPIHEWIYIFHDEKSRYILGRKGENPLFVFGINPSTAKPNDLDNTLKSVERITKGNGYDSWIMFNVYPQRATDPNNMHKNMNKELHNNNLLYFEKFLQQYKNINIWAAWGSIIKKRDYLNKCLIDIINVAEKYNCQWFSGGEPTKDCHPKHPLYMKKTTKLIPYNISIYKK